MANNKPHTKSSSNYGQSTVQSKRRYKYLFCNQCNLEFPSSYKYRIHLYSVHLKRKFQCDKCQMTFTAPAGLYNHKNKKIDCSEMFQVSPLDMSSDSGVCPGEDTLVLYAPILLDDSDKEIEKEISQKCNHFEQVSDDTAHKATDVIQTLNSSDLTGVPQIDLPNIRTSDYVCVICTQVFCKKGQLKKHMKTSHRFRIALMQKTGRSPWMENWKLHFKTKKQHI